MKKMKKQKKLIPYILKDYIINLKTKHIVKDSKNLGKAFRDSKKWREATKEEVENYKSKKLKSFLINIRINILNILGIRYFDDLKNMPKEIKEKREKAREEINKIEKIDNLKDLKKYE